MIELKLECIHFDLKATSKESVLKELSQIIADEYDQLDSHRLFHALSERELIGSTGVGQGVAVPHAKISSINNIILCFGRSSGGIPFDALDKRPVFLFTALLAPKTIASEYLQALALTTTVLKQEENRELLLQSQFAEDIQALFIK